MQHIAGRVGLGVPIGHGDARVGGITMVFQALNVPIVNVLLDRIDRHGFDLADVHRS